MTQDHFDGRLDALFYKLTAAVAVLGITIAAAAVAIAEAL